MKFANLRALEKHLEAAGSQHLSPIYGVFGKDDFARKEALETLLKYLPEPVHFDGDKFHAANFFADLQGASLFSPKKTVVLSQCDKLNKPHIEALERYFITPNPDVTLVLTAPQLNRATNYYKKAEKAGVLLEIPEEKPWEKEKRLREWLMHRAAKEERTLSFEAADFLVKQVGTDQTLLLAELDKLICFAGSRKEVTRRDVGVMTASINHDSIWQLAEALFQRKPAAAMLTAKACLAEGTALIALIRQLRGQFQTEFTICCLLRKGAGISEISREFPYMAQTILNRHIQQASAYGLPRFAAAMRLIDRIELEAKNSGASADHLLELLISSLCIGNKLYDA